MNKPADHPTSSASPPPLLQAVKLSKIYSMGPTLVPVLKEVELSVAPGETVAIVGASGAGKSTLLHILGGLDSPSAGRVFFGGQDLYGLTPRKRTALRARQIGFVFQFYHLLPELDVLENVLLPTMIRMPLAVRRGWAGAARPRALELLRAVGLAQRADHLPRELSGGEQQRVALVRALMNQPQLLLADEPTGNLDATTGAQVLEALLSLVRRSGHTLIMVTHNQTVAQRCQRTLELRDGRLVAAGVSV